MFDCIDQLKKHWISLEDYMTYMDVLIHGNEKEKLKQSFALLDIRGRNKVTYPDFLEVAVNVTRMWSAAYGKPVELDETVIEKLFSTISNSKKYFKSKDYVSVVKKHPDLMQWLTKPKELLDEKLEKNVAAKEKSYSTEMINEIISDTKIFIDEVIQTIEKVLKVFRASRDDVKRRSKSFSIKTDKNPFKKEQSVKLQDIVKKEFVLKQETIKTATKTNHNQFLPGVERKKLKKKTTGANDSMELTSLLKDTPKPEMIKLNISNSTEKEGGSNGSDSETLSEKERSKAFAFGSSKCK